jgi:hypothetical protein
MAGLEHRPPEATGGTSCTGDRGSGPLSHRSQAAAWSGSTHAAAGLVSRVVETVPLVDECTNLFTDA